MPAIPTSPAENNAFELDKSDLLWLFVLCACGIMWTATYFDRGLDAFDAGLFATEADRILSGGVYGKDFIAPYGPGRYYLIALLFSVLGPTLKVQALLWLFLRGVVGSLVFLTGRCFLPRALALLPALAIIAAPGALHKSFFQLAVLLNLLAYLNYRYNRSWRASAIAGFVVGMGALFRVDAGFFGACSFLLLLAMEFVFDRKEFRFSAMLKHAAGFVIGAAVVLLPVFFYFLAVADVKGIFEAEWHRVHVVSGFADYLNVPTLADAINADYPQSIKLFLLGGMLRSAAFVYLLLLVMTIIERIKGQSATRCMAMLAVVIFGIPVLNQVRITPTFNHLLHAIPLVLIGWTLCAWSIRRMLHPSRVASVAFALLIIVIPLSAPVYYNLAHTRGVLPGSVASRVEFTEPIELPRAGIYETIENARELEKIVGYILRTTKPDETVFSGPFTPVLNFLADRPPAIRFLEPFYYFGSEPLQKKVIEDLARTKPAMVIIDPEIRVGRQSLEVDAPLVFDFIKQHYKVLSRTGAKAGRYRIWLRRD